MLLVLLQRVQRIWTKMPCLYNGFVTCNSFSKSQNLNQRPSGSVSPKASIFLLVASCSQQVGGLEVEGLTFQELPLRDISDRRGQRGGPLHEVLKPSNLFGRPDLSGGNQYKAALPALGVFCFASL